MLNMQFYVLALGILAIFVIMLFAVGILSKISKELITQNIVGDAIKKAVEKLQFDLTNQNNAFSSILTTTGDVLATINSRQISIGDNLKITNAATESFHKENSSILRDIESHIRDAFKFTAIPKEKYNSEPIGDTKELPTHAALSTNSERNPNTTSLSQADDLIDIAKDLDHKGISVKDAVVPKVEYDTQTDEGSDKSYPAPSTKKPSGKSHRHKDKLGR